jgi:hypothetical protein
MDKNIEVFRNLRTGRWELPDNFVEIRFPRTALGELPDKFVEGAPGLPDKM